jgi:hypothetical protein
MSVNEKKFKIKILYYFNIMNERGEGLRYSFRQMFYTFSHLKRLFY